MQDEVQHFQSSCSPRVHPYRDHRCRRARQWCATDMSATASTGSFMETYANNTLGTDKLNQLVLVRALGCALSIGLEVAQVTNVTLLVGWRAVSLAERVDYVECRS